MKARQTPPRPWPARYAWPLATALALVGATGVWVISDQAARNDPYSYYGKKNVRPRPGELLRGVIARADERVVVAPEVPVPVDPKSLAEARRILSEADTELYLFVLPEANQGGASLYTHHGAAEILGAEVLGGKPGWVVTYYPDGSTVVSEQGNAPGQYLSDTDGQPGPALVRIATEMASWSLTEDDD